MKKIENQTFDMERALYGSENIYVKNCNFDGPEDGESALKECRNIKVEDCFWNLRYPFWHDHGLKISKTELTQFSRAALWYSDHIEITETKLHGIKALRECRDVVMRDCDIISPEFGWSVKNVAVQTSHAESEYFFMHAQNLDFSGVTLKGKYSFQYIEDAMFEKCRFDTKDAFWHAKNVTVKDSVIKGEYLAWYSDGLTLINCKITGTQPFCYCRNLKLVDCEMTDTDLAFEKSEVEAVILTPVISIKNPLSGTIHVPDVGNIILDDKDAKGEIKIDETIKKEHQITACA
ncbi:DUF3737 family protein [Blautia pseudococcoides]|uniref:DUF3737 family protein n=1 Tax=Blautia pseudococcoides TaxID=1796616 RepID=UPI00148B0B0C|nr:DUF3737 family protein [Blautia pseudococcoides]QJU15348.1 DUF3737 family protein [Blautia pseudococcoides]